MRILLVDDEVELTDPLSRLQPVRVALMWLMMGQLVPNGGTKTATIY